MIPTRRWRPILHTMRFSGRCRSCKPQALIWSWYVASMVGYMDPLTRLEDLLQGQSAVVAVC